MLRKIVSTLLFTGTLLATAPAFAQEAAKLGASGDEPVRSTLEALKKKPVTLRLGTGEEITGTVAEIGDNAVLISGLSGKDFYDALVLFDSISAVIYKAR